MPGLLVVVLTGALALYMYTAHPGPGWVDSGELAAVSHSLGIPHPTGSPLYVVISRLASLAGQGAFWPLTLLSALATTLAVAFLVLALPPARRSLDTIALAAVGVMLVTSPSLWSQAIVNEVYALQALLFALFIFNQTRAASFGRTALSAFLAGLAFANHQSAIFLSPFLVADLWAGRRQARVWLTVFGFGLLGTTLYLYLPLRSSAGPLLDWGGTHRWSAFWRHITGWQYKNWVGLGSWNEYRSAFEFFGTHLARHAAFVGLPLAAYGWWTLWRGSRAAAVTQALAALLCLAFGVNFPNPDLQSFFLLVYLLCAYWAGVGLLRLAQWRAAWGWATALVLLAGAGVLATRSFAGVNARDFRVPSQWVEDALATMEPGSVVLTREWDHYSPWLYLRFVQGVRPDVTWIDTELLRRSWYPEFIRRADPARYEAAMPALERLAPEIRKFESGSPYNPADIERAYADAIFALSLGQTGPVYVDGIARSSAEWGVERGYLRGAVEVPWGLVMRAFRPGEPVASPPAWPDYQSRATRQQDSERTRFHLGLYGRMRDLHSRYSPPR